MMRAATDTLADSRVRPRVSVEPMSHTASGGNHEMPRLPAGSKANPTFAHGSGARPRRMVGHATKRRSAGDGRRNLSPAATSPRRSARRGPRVGTARCRSRPRSRPTAAASPSRLDRTVAIKTTHASFDPRFQREVRAIAALNHPNVCTLHDVGPNYLVMEFCEGETLAARLKRGKLSVDDPVKYGAQIAAALAVAHARGITHRDLKPGNVILTKLDTHDGVQRGWRHPNGERRSRCHECRVVVARRQMDCRHRR